MKRYSAGAPEQDRSGATGDARPARVAAELLAAREDPVGVEEPATAARAIAPLAARFALPRGDAVAFLEWLLEVAGIDESEEWARRARVGLVSPDSPPAGGARS